ncbi:MAG: LysM peptidoglycan-binding domain-containing protein, partial [Myxococcota bacterium]
MKISKTWLPALALPGLLATGCAAFSGQEAAPYAPRQVAETEGGDSWVALDGGPDVKPFGDSQGKKARLYFRKRGGRTRALPRETFRDPAKILPAEVKGQVQEYVDYFTGRGRKHVQRWLNRSNRYMPMMKRTFAEHGLPPDLVYVSMIESGFNPFAVSRARAVGMWQFISSTGRRYDLKINRYVDERRDPVKATRAAAQYLRDLYEMFDSWDLALASYNAGEGKIGKGVRRYSTDNFWEIRKTRYLRTETKDYVPKYLAALMIAKNPRKYGFSLADYEGPVRYQLAQVKGGVSLKSAARACGISTKALRNLNPELRRSVTPPGKAYTLKVPTGLKKEVHTQLAALKADRRAVASSGRHRVRRGETLSTIARRYGVSTRSLARANHMSTRDVLRAGKRLRIPGKGGVALAKAAVHVVKRGDTLGKIARRYGVSLRALARANNMRITDILRTGMSLRRPGRTR